MIRLYRKKHLREHKKFALVEMEIENQPHFVKEKNIADSMRLVVCWNVDSVEQVYHADGGTAVQSIKRQFGNV